MDAGLWEQSCACWRENMNITVRLYKLHDYDLIYLYKNLRFPIKDAMKKALLAYVRNEPVFFDFPVKKIDMDHLENLKNAQFHIKLDKTEDADAINYLSGLKKFYRNSFLKNLLRGYLAGPAAYVYEVDIDADKNRERNDSIKNQILGIETLPLMKQRKKRKDYVILTEDQKELFDKTGALDDVEIIIRNQGKKLEGD